ncbi:hypothetical protein ARMA_0281 [Ardenticatena maritima]|uniref:Uncharacterized protein n=1 Tax=Ardenticatena maritima TaxID=872965 RepID=A0A0N0RFD8_9CHLR|nr:hypothetical protein ARMA_0281 [Ardenticatena maritima]
MSARDWRKVVLPSGLSGWRAALSFSVRLRYNEASSPESPSCARGFLYAMVKG